MSTDLAVQCAPIQCGFVSECQAMISPVDILGWHLRTYLMINYKSYFIIPCHVSINIIACLSYCMICVIFFLHIIEVTSPSLNLTWDLSKSNLYGFFEMDESIHWREQITRNDTSQVHCEIGPLKTTPAAECWALNVANTVNKAEWIFALECAHWA